MLTKLPRLSFKSIVVRFKSLEDQTIAARISLDGRVFDLFFEGKKKREILKMILEMLGANGYSGS